MGPEILTTSRRDCFENLHLTTFGKHKQTKEQTNKQTNKPTNKQASKQTKQIILPSGRRYCFPDTQWTKWGTATNRTAICNYPVQGFATADILPCCLVDLEKRLRPYKSLICNTVHDSIVIDCHPDEEEQVVAILKFSRDRWVCAPHNLLESIFLVPKLSDSVLFLFGIFC